MKSIFSKLFSNGNEDRIRCVARFSPREIVRRLFFRTHVTRADFLLLSPVNVHGQKIKKTKERADQKTIPFSGYSYNRISSRMKSVFETTNYREGILRGGFFVGRVGLRKGRRCANLRTRVLAKINL